MSKYKVRFLSNRSRLFCDGAQVGEITMKDEYSAPVIKFATDDAERAWEAHVAATGADEDEALGELRDDAEHV